MKGLVLILALMCGNTFAGKSIDFHIECDVDCLELENVDNGKFTKITKKPAMILRANDILDARVSREEGISNEYLGLTLSKEGAKKFEKITGDNISKRLAIVVDNEILMFPMIQQKIKGGSVQITFGAGGSAESFLQENAWLAKIIGAKVESNDRENQWNLLAYIFFGVAILGGTLFYAFREKRQVV